MEAHGTSIVSRKYQGSHSFSEPFPGVGPKGLRWSSQFSGGSNQARWRGHLLRDVGRREGTRQTGLPKPVKSAGEHEHGATEIHGSP